MAFTMPIDLIGLPTIYNVRFPVGPNMPNQRDDVMLVQTLMKLANFTRFTPALGPVEASRDIAVDGIFGPQTKRMITAFEANRRSAGLLLISDGVVESSSKDGFTGRGVLFKIIHLNRSAKNADEFRYADLPFNPETNAILRGALQPGAVRPPRPRQPGT
jgi:peptidoglycan hydrolase-like protein with peptidoglycan-binding domain